MNLANNYSGGTNVNAGTLAIGNANGSATGTGPVTIAASAILTGSGFISSTGTNAVSVNGAITPGSSPGIYNTLTVSAVKLNTGSTLNLNFLTASPGQHDLINTTGTLSLGAGTININVANQSGTWSPRSLSVCQLQCTDQRHPDVQPREYFWSGRLVATEHRRERPRSDQPRRAVGRPRF